MKALSQEPGVPPAFGTARRRDGRRDRPEPARRRRTAGRRWALWLPFLLGVPWLLALMGTSATPEETRPRPPGWWPEQTVPAAFLESPAAATRGEQVLQQALAGLAARAVNEGRGDELVWIDFGHPQAKVWQQRTLARWPTTVTNRARLDVWSLLQRCRERNLVKGFVTYTEDQSAGPAYAVRTNVDLTLNLATSLAGLLDAVPVAASLTERVRALGLAELEDVRGQTFESLLARCGSRLNRQLVVLLDPQAPAMRDFAVAHRALVDFQRPPGPMLSLAWAEPLAPVIGWGTGDEFRHTAPITRSGHFHTASNWGQNLPFLSAGARSYRPRRVRPVIPTASDLADRRPSIAFLMSDGDNLGWLLNNFLTPGAGGAAGSYWSHPDHGRFPIGFTACFGDLLDAAPVVVDSLAESQPRRTSLTQFAGGYFYPDLFAADLTNRLDLLRQHARRISRRMHESGAASLAFICQRSDTPDALDAMRVFAEEIQPLVGMLVMDYAPYHRMDGLVRWIPDGRGGEVPAVAAHYSLWRDLQGPRAGDPARVARAIAQDVESGIEPGWAVVHAWSTFDAADGHPGTAGVGAVARCLGELDQARIRVVAPDEMLWTLRHRRAPAATRALLEQFMHPDRLRTGG